MNKEGWPHWSGCFVVLVRKAGGEGSDPRLLREGEPDHGFKAGGGHIHTPILLASQCPAWSTLRISVPYLLERQSCTRLLWRRLVSPPPSVAYADGQGIPPISHVLHQLLRSYQMPKCKDCNNKFAFLELKKGVCQNCINKKTPPCSGCSKTVVAVLKTSKCQI